MCLRPTMRHKRLHQHKFPNSPTSSNSKFPAAMNSHVHNHYTMATAAWVPGSPYCTGPMSTSLSQSVHYHTLHTVLSTYFRARGLLQHCFPTRQVDTTYRPAHSFRCQFHSDPAVDQIQHGKVRIWVQRQHHHVSWPEFFQHIQQTIQVSGQCWDTQCPPPPGSLCPPNPPVKGLSNMHSQGFGHTLQLIIYFQLPELPKGQQMLNWRHVVLWRRRVHGSEQRREVRVTSEREGQVPYLSDPVLGFSRELA